MSPLLEKGQACPRCGVGVLVEGTMYLTRDHKPGEPLVTVPALRCVGDDACGGEWIDVDGKGFHELRR